MEWLWYIIGVIAGLIIVYSIFYAICRKYPWIRIVLALTIGIASYFVWYEWWASLIVFFFTFGFFLVLTSSSTKRGNNIYCLNCQHDMLDILEETDNYIKYYCPKCKTKGTIHLWR